MLVEPVASVWNPGQVMYWTPAGGVLTSGGSPPAMVTPW